MSTAGYEGGDYVDERARRWQRVDDYLEPADATELVDAGTPVLVEWCGQGGVPESIDPATVRGGILPTLLDRRRAQRKLRRRSVPTVFVPELWRSADDQLVIFVEGPPGPRRAP